MPTHVPGVPGLLRTSGDFAVKLAAAELSEDSVASSQAIVEFVARLGCIGGDHLANWLSRNRSQDLFGSSDDAHAVIKRLVVSGYLEARPVVVETARVVGTKNPPAALAKRLKDTRFLKRQFTYAFSVTKKAALDHNLPLPPTTRENFINHHFKTVEACFRAELELKARGYRVRSMTAESQLIKENFKGQIFNGQQNIVPKFPDAMMEVEAPDGTTQHINVEYVSTKYTDEMIREKAAAFRGPTIWAVSTPKQVARVQRITGANALLV